MCLTINRIYHPYKEELFETNIEACRWANNNPALPKPYVAVEDMEVYKVLSKDRNTGDVETPARKKKVKFKCGKCTLWVRRMACKPHAHVKEFEADSPFYEKFVRFVNEFIVEEGIHAFTNRTNAETFSSWSTRWWPNWENCERYTYVYRAVIPKGTKFYYGLRGDVVAEKLIIYERKDI